MKPNSQQTRRIALVLSGGGARGAYEVGVLCNLLPRMAALGIEINIYAATSVGALNACSLVSTAHMPGVAGARRRAYTIRSTWETIDAEKVFKPVFASSLISLPLHLANLSGPQLQALWPDSGSGNITRRVKTALNWRPYRYQALYDTTPLGRTVKDGTIIDWNQFQHNLDGGVVDALALSATSIHSGETVVFTQSNDLREPRLVRDEHMRLLPTKINHHHALASAAIPFLFPPARVFLPNENRHALFMDGGVRQNTPLLPAILLGADSILVIGLHTNEPEPLIEDERSSFDVVPILGKILNAFFLDRVRTDFNRLEIMNRLIRNAEPSRLEAINQERQQRGKDVLREIRAFEVTPSRDIGRLISELWARRQDLHRPPWRWLFNAREMRSTAFGDLLSYIFFHPEFSRVLMKLGEDDAAREMSDERLRWLGGLPGAEEP